VIGGSWFVVVAAGFPPEGGLPQACSLRRIMARSR